MKVVEVGTKDFEKTTRLWAEESERGAAVLAGSFVESHLGLYLKSCMADTANADTLFDSNGPLSSFSQRIDIARAFGFISPGEARQLHTIRKIRNHFAHHPLVTSFDSSPIREWVDSLGSELESYFRDEGGNPIDTSELPQEILEYEREVRTRKHQFLSVIAVFVAQIDMIMYDARKKKKLQGSP